MPDFLNQSFAGLTGWQWISLGLSVLIVLVVLVIGRRILKALLNLIMKRVTAQTKTVLDDMLISAVEPSLYIFSIVAAFDIAFSRLDFIGASIQAFLNDLFFVAYVLAAFLLILRVMSVVFEYFSNRMVNVANLSIGTQMLPFFRRILLGVVMVIGLIIVLDHFDVEISGLVATLGVTSIAVALAAQAALEDTISGFLIVVDQPYRIGDRIDVQDLDTVGDVVDIGLRSTRIRTIDNRMIIVPNSVIGKSQIVNRAFPDAQYRIYVTVGVAYGADVDMARQVMLRAVRGVEGVVRPPDEMDQSTGTFHRDVEALFTSMGDSALIFDVRFWVDTYADTYVMADRVNTAVYKALNEAGIEIPFPQRDVHHKFSVEDAEVLRNVLNGAARS